MKSLQMDSYNFYRSAKWEIFRDQIIVLVSREFKLKYNATALGFLWSLVTPILQSCVYYFIFKAIIRFDVENYLLFVLSGTFLWQFFCNVTLTSGATFLSNSWVFKKTSVPSFLLVLGILFTELIHLLLVIPLLLIVMCFSGVPPTWSLLLLPLALLNICLFSLGFSFIYATLNLFFRDLERIMQLLFQVWMFACPVMIPFECVPEKYQPLFRINPMTPILDGWRAIFYRPAFDWTAIGLSFVFAALFFAIGYSVYRSQESKFVELM